MPRRVSLPGAEELFRATVPEDEAPPETTTVVESGRVKHDEKVTIYLTADELLDVEQARVRLRAELGRSVDRGRFVRAAIANALEDYAERGPESDVARRLSET